MAEKKSDRNIRQNNQQTTNNNVCSIFRSTPFIIKCKQFDSFPILQYCANNWFDSDVNKNNAAT